MNSPIQARPVNRTSVAPSQATTQSGCCVQVAGVCVASSPFC
jgi:hypothetical protein